MSTCGVGPGGVGTEDGVRGLTDEGGNHSKQRAACQVAWELLERAMLCRDVMGSFGAALGDEGGSQAGNRV